VLPIELPKCVTAHVDGVPVLECEYGSHKNQRALRVLRVINHSNQDGTAAEIFVKGPMPTAQESDHE
jgi:flagellar motor switch protein FliM